MSLIYKILDRPAWEAAKVHGAFLGSAIDEADGYIHFSTADQAQETAGRYFRGQADLVLLAVEAEGLGEALKWEPARGGALFPHLYGPLDVGHVLRAQAIALGADGAPQLGPLDA